MPEPSPSISHVEWQAQIVELAHTYGWRHLHVRRTIGRGKKWTTSTNVKGWPDLLFWHPSRGGCFAAELKVGRDTVTDEQEAVLAELAASGLPAYVWRGPADLDRARHAFDTLRGSFTPLP